MIEAAVACAHGEGNAPAELRLAWWCKEWGAMPDSGGLHEQDYTTLTRMTALDNIYRAVTKLKNAAGADIHRLTTGERRIIGWLRREGIV